MVEAVRAAAQVNREMRNVPREFHVLITWMMRSSNAFRNSSNKNGSSVSSVVYVLL